MHENANKRTYKRTRTHDSLSLYLCFPAARSREQVFHGIAFIGRVFKDSATTYRHRLYHVRACSEYSCAWVHLCVRGRVRACVRVLMWFCMRACVRA
jgi:hypothetical protein